MLRCLLMPASSSRFLCLQLLLLATTTGAGLPAHVETEMLAAIRAFDHDTDGTVRAGELSLGLLSALEWDERKGQSLSLLSAHQRHTFGEEQCADPTLDALSFVECAVARARAGELGSPRAPIDAPALLSLCHPLLHCRSIWLHVLLLQEAHVLRFAPLVALWPHPPLA